MRRRRLAGAASGFADGLQSVLSMLLQNRMVGGRMAAQNQAAQDNQALSSFNTEANSLLDPSKISEMGPERVQAQYLSRRKMLPAHLQGRTGEMPDFASMDSKPEQRVGALVAELGGITNADDPRLTPTGLRKRAVGMRIPETQTETGWMPNESEEEGLIPSKSIRSETTQNPALAELEALISGQKEGLLAKEPVTSLDEMGPDGVMRSRVMRNRDIPAGGINSRKERTPAEEAARAAQVRTATDQAGQNVLNDPQNIKGFASREAAVAYARTAAGNRADATTKVTTQVVEKKLPTGETVYQVVNTSPSQAGAEYSGGFAPTTDAERTAFGYANRGSSEHAQMLTLESELIKRGNPGISYLQFKAPDVIKDPLTRQYVGSMRRFINASLGRPESGGAITEEEFQTYGAANAFAPGDDSVTLADKQRARREALQGLTTKAGPRLGEMFTTADELQQLPSSAGKDLNTLIKEAEDAGYRVIR